MRESALALSTSPYRSSRLRSVVIKCTHHASLRHLSCQDVVDARWHNGTTCSLQGKPFIGNSCSIAMLGTCETRWSLPVESVTPLCAPFHYVLQGTCEEAQVWKSEALHTFLWAKAWHSRFICLEFHGVYFQRSLECCQKW